MLRALAALTAAMPAGDPSREAVMAALARGLTARNQDFVAQGVPNKNTAMEVLVLVNRAFDKDREFIRRTLSAEALNALAKLASAQYRHGISPLGPQEWGSFLEYIVWKNGR